MKFDHVIAYGRDTYVRLYPNPGVGVSFGTYRIALSIVGGFEVFRAHPVQGWIRIFSILNRRKMKKT